MRIDMGNDGNRTIIRSSEGTEVELPPPQSLERATYPLSLVSRKGMMAGALVVLWLSCGCAGIMPLPKHTVGPGGEERSADLTSIHAGQTSRAEVAEKLRPFDTGYQSEQFFLARWRSSTWGWFAMGNTSGGGGRHWSNSTVVIAFDGKGIVKSVEAVPDNLLVKKLEPVAEEHRAFDPAERVELEVGTRRGLVSKIILSHGTFEFVENELAKNPRHFVVAATKITSIDPGRFGGADPIYTNEVIHIEESASGGRSAEKKKLSVQINVRDLVTLLAYLRQARVSPNSALPNAQSSP